MEEIIANFGNVQRVLEATISNVSAEMHNLRSQMIKFQQSHQTCTMENIVDTRFNKILVGELSLGLEEQRTDIPVFTILRDESGKYHDNNQMAVITASDGSIMAKRGRQVAAATAYFGHTWVSTQLCHGGHQRSIISSS